MDIAKSSFFSALTAEREEILKHKWYESERAGHDIGFARALIDWTVRFKSKWIKERNINPQQSI